MRTTLILACIFLLVNLVNAQTEQIELPSLQSLQAFGPFDITLVKADHEKIEIDYNGIDKDEINIKFSGGDVNLKFKNKHYTRDWNSSRWEHRAAKYARVTIYFKELKEIDIKAGALVKSESTVKSKYLYLACSMGAEMDLDVKAKKIELLASMGSDVQLTGETETLELLAKMGATVKASRLESEIVYTRASMGADVYVYASQELEVSSGFGATVNYTGGPSVRHTSKTFGGEVHRRQ